MRNWRPTSERTSRESWCLCLITAFSISGRAFVMIPGHICKWCVKSAIFTAISICKPASPMQPIRLHHTPDKSLLKVSPSNQARKSTRENLRLTTQITVTSDFYLPPLQIICSGFLWLVAWLLCLLYPSCQFLLCAPLVSFFAVRALRCMQFVVTRTA